MRANLFRHVAIVLYLSGSACLALWLWTVSDRAWFQWRYRAIDATPAPAGSTSLREGPIGRIEIPRVGVSALILEGVDSRTLRRGVGHVPGTSYPGGSAGRIALAGHRDTVFRKLQFVRTGDSVKLIVPGRTSLYVIERTEVVKPWRTEVLRPVHDDVLTLVTCFPFTYLGSAPERFVVQARRIGPGPSTLDLSHRIEP